MDNILDRPESSGVCNLTFQLQENDIVHNCTENNSINTIYSEDSYEIEIGREIITEALPRLQNYRYSRGPSKRPSLGTLHGQHDSVKDKLTGLTPSATFLHTIKLGWIQGVLIPCLLNIWGVMLFLRLSWVVAEAGIGLSLVIIAISAVVCVITTLSLSALCSNGEVKGGGIYYIISRSLGPEFGASVGIVFAFANAVSASMNTIGFCNSLSDLLGDHYIIDKDGQNDARIIGTAATLVMILICAVGMDWESKVQNVLITTIVGAMLDFILGTILGPRYQEQEARGFVGFSTNTFSENWGPMWRPVDNVTYDFFQVFAIFFPSVTGIQAGANISGDLKDPSSAIPKGTFLSLLISMTSYALFVIFAGGAALRDASGNATDLRNVSFCADSRSCKYGLFNSYQMMQIMSLWGPLIYAGCFAATLSTALTNLLSVPRLIQALGNDKIYPGLKYFSKGYGKYGEPYRGYVLTFFVSVAFLLIADLNAIAPLISNFYLASYALINFCTFHAALVKPLGWRPDFKFYSTWLSLFGFIICIAIMFLINWWASIITFILILGLYLVVVYRKPDVNWGSSTQAQTYKTALLSVLKLTNIEDHVKNYKPQILLLCGNPKSRPMLVKYANLITKNNSLLIVADVEQQKLSHRKRSTRISNAYQYLKDNKIKAFYNIIDNVSYEIGITALLEVTGLGNLKPNVLMIGYKRNWNACSEQELNSYFNTFQLNDGFKSNHNRKLIEDDKSNIKEEDNSNMSSKTNTSTRTIEIGSSNVILNSINTGAKNKAGLSRESDAGDLPLKSNLKVTENSTILKKINTLKRKPKKGIIDVWWLYDDGGLTMLISYIISKRSNWSNCNLRIFALVANKNDSDMEEKW